ncbi:MAG: peptide chain release factor 2 [Clostridiales bacterium]|nr:peptide chain release factor 2 [Clostridiales bacterium]MDD7432504.1 peptide chain release factor 2 [Clostridiales bacterium]MDY3061411.1 peptide chain release factor 2 [Eubacteriales bacterium]
MIEFEEDKEKIREGREKLAELRQALHMEKTELRMEELEHRSAEPEFWNDLEEAKKVQKELTHLKNKRDNFFRLSMLLDDAEVLIELGEEEDDQQVADEVRKKLKVFANEAEALSMETYFTGELDANNAILTLHAGAGGTEACDWTGMLFRMYSRWAEDHDFKLSVLDSVDGEEAGIKSISFKMEGENAYGLLSSEMGVHRLVRISPFDSSGRRHTSFASVEVLPELDDSINIEVRPEDLRVDTYRSSGKGGQHVNKTSSAVRLTHLPTGVVVACQNERSQIQNREVAMQMLKAKLYTMARQAQLDRVEDLKGEQMDIGWGSQIRSYVFCPYTLVKDNRTGVENSDVGAVMDGELDPFIRAWLAQRVSSNDKNIG